MTNSATNCTRWEEIERSESYLVSCMYEEAVSISLSVLRDLCQNKSTKAGEDTQLDEMLESAGMVLAQSLKELGRTQEILDELKLLFGSVTAIPIEVFLAGVCFQLSEGPCLGTQELLEEFLSKWRYVDEQHYVLERTESSNTHVNGRGDSIVMGVDKYLEVVEVYAVTLLGRILIDRERAITWVDKAALPEDKRQEVLRRLNSLPSPNHLGSTQSPGLDLPSSGHDTGSSSLKERKFSEGSTEALNAYSFKGENDMKKTLWELSRQKAPVFWWFRTINLKFGNSRLVISNGKIVFSCLMVLMFYLLQRKQAAVKRILKRQVTTMKKGLVDLWQLMFSYQVNPLAAAVQPLSTAASARISR